jgi:hypothetical protein
VGALPASSGCDPTAQGRCGLYIGSTSAPITRSSTSRAASSTISAQGRRRAPGPSLVDVGRLQDDPTH